MPPENRQIQSGRLPQSQVQSGRVGPMGPVPIPPPPRTPGAGGTVTVGSNIGQERDGFLKTLFKHPIGLSTSIGEGLASLTPQVREARRTIEENRKAVQDIIQHSSLDERNRKMLSNVLEDMPVWGDVMPPKTSRELADDILGTALWFTPYKMIKPFSAAMKGGQMLNLMTRSAIIGGGFSTANALGDDDASASEIISQGLKGALGGAAFGVGIGAVGMGAGLGMQKISQAMSKMETPRFVQVMLPVYRRFGSVFGEPGKDVGNSILAADRFQQSRIGVSNHMLETAGFNRLSKKARYSLSLMLEGKKPVTEALKPAYNAVRRIDKMLAKSATRAGVKTTVNISPRDTQQIMTTIQRHFGSSKQVISNLSPEQIKKAGGMKFLLERTRENITMQLDRQGYANISKAVKGLNVNKFKTISQYEKAVNKLFTVDPSGRITQIPFVERANHYPHAVPSLGQLQKPAFKADVIQSSIDRGYFTNKKAAGKVLDSWAEYIRTGGAKKSGIEYVNWLVKSGRAADHNQARRMALQHLNQLKSPRFGLMEYQRALDFPFINPDPLDVIPYYISGSLKRIGELKYYGGPNQQLFVNAINKVKNAKGYESAKEFENLIKQTIGVADQYPEWQRKFGAIVMTMNTPKLSFAQVLNTAQSVNTLLHTDAPTTLKAISLAFTKKGYLKALKTGALNDNVMIEIQTALGAGGGSRAQQFSQKFLKYTGFTAVDRFNRIVAANAGMSYTQKTFQKLMLNPTNKALRARLMEYGINPDKALKAGRLTESQILNSGQVVSELTQFRARPIDMPLFYQSPTGRVMLQFKNFSYNQSRFLLNEFQREIGAGNYSRVIRDLTVLGTVFPMTGEVIGDIRSLMSGSTRPTEPLRRYMENVMMVGGMGLWGDFIDATRWGRLYEFIGGPSISTGVGMTERTGQILTGRRKPNKQDMRFMLRQTGFGTTIANYVFPNNPSERERFLETMMDYIDEL